ncbi:MAG: trypsin-like peptidase domain-containing protein, partial [Candidatus Levybacteria bacterium]|nr:trypsin-like peptidase domain-containing protein [Candidatus Levybacteria bacterium]
MRRLILLILVLIGVLFLISAAQTYIPQIFNIDTARFAPKQTDQNIKVVTEESVTIDIVKKTGPSVVTVAAANTSAGNETPFDFGPFFGLPGEEQEGPSEPQDIGSGFIIGTEGLVVTNKHVVSDPDVEYRIITSNDKEYTVQRIYRDPLNDIALLQIDLAQNPGEQLKVLELGDSSKLQAGQYVAAIGTSLGEFRNSVTTGVISGLGRGITAGSPYEGAVERLDNVIQTDAAINPGNSGGPLFNATGQVIGINTAVSASGQNIGFAIPINVIKESLNNFNETGMFERPYLGVSYRIVNEEVARINDLPQGAFVQEVIAGSSAEEAGIKPEDVLTKIDGKEINEDTPLSSFISQKKIGDTITITLIRGEETLEVAAVLKVAP